jgi:autotransporter-associated beta strand protein
MKNHPFFNSLLAGTMTLTKTGIGTLTIGTTNTYSGGNIISNGSVAVSGGGSIGSGSLTLAGGVLNLGGSSQTVGAVNLLAAAATGDTLGNGSISAPAYTVSFSSGTASISANLSGAGTLTVTNGASLILTGSNNFSGLTTIASGGTLQIGNGGTNGTLPANNTVQRTGAVTSFLAFNRTDSVASPLVVSNTISTLSIVVNSGAVQLAGSGNNVNSGVDVKTNATLILAKSGTRAIGNVVASSLVEPGGTLQLAGSGGDQIVDAPGLTVNGVSDLNGRSETCNLLIGGAGNGAGALINSTAATTATFSSASFGLTGHTWLGGAGNLIIPSPMFGYYYQKGYGPQSDNNDAAWGITKIGGGTLTFSGTNTYAGTTLINAGKLALAGNGSIADSSSIMIAAGATLDVFGLAAATFNLSAATTLTASGTGVGATAATLIGAVGGSINLGAQPVTLNFDGANPALFVAQGILSLNGNAFTINTLNGLPPSAGTYTLIQQASGAISGSGNFSVVGTAVGFERAATISVSGNAVLLTVSAPSGWTVTPVGGATLTDLTAKFAAQPGYDYLVEATTNLATGPWTLIGEFGPFVVTNQQTISLKAIDPGFGSSNQRFYRLSGFFSPETIPSQSAPSNPFRYYVGQDPNGIWKWTSDFDNYQPYYPPGPVEFDEKGRPCIRHGTLIYTITDNNTGWETRDAAPAILAAYPNWNGSLLGDPYGDERVLFDAAGNAYTFMNTAYYNVNAAPNSLNGVALFLFSTDHCRTWKIYPVTAPSTGAAFSLWEARDANSNRQLPPAMGFWSNNYWQIVNLTKHGVGTNTTLTITNYTLTPTANSFGAINHSGGSQLVSHGNKVFLAYGSQTVTNLAVTSPNQNTNGVPCYAITFDRVALTNSAPTFLGYGGAGGGTGTEVVNGVVVTNGVMDGHNMPAITVTSNGTLHAVLCGHHYPYLFYRKSTSPDNTSAWDACVEFGHGPSASGGGTYTSLACDANDRLHLALRYSAIPGGFYCVAYTTLDTRTNSPLWSPMLELAHPTTGSYYAFHNHISFNPVANQVYLFFELYHSSFTAVNEYVAYVNTWPLDGVQNQIPNFSTANGYIVQPHLPALLYTGDGGMNWRLAGSTNFINDLQP